MRKSFLIFLALGVLCGADDERARHKADMDTAQDLKDELADYLGAKDSAKVTEPAGKLVRLGEQEVQFWQKASVPEGVKIARENLAAAKALQTAAKAGQIDQAAAAFTKLNDTCRSCHDLHFEKQWNTDHK